MSAIPKTHRRDPSRKTDMERERQITRAKQVLRNLMGDFIKPHPRMHTEAAEDNVNRLRALEGICGSCSNLDPRFSHIHGRDRVVLNCTKKHIPLALYRETPMGEEAVCRDFDKIK
jgi:hypothetical protein